MEYEFRSTIELGSKRNITLQDSWNYLRKGAENLLRTTGECLKADLTTSIKSNGRLQETILFCTSFLGVLLAASAGYTAVHLGGVFGIPIATLTSGPFSGAATYLITSQKIPAVTALIVGTRAVLHTSGAVLSCSRTFITSVVVVLTIFVAIFGVSHLSRFGILLSVQKVCLSVAAIFLVVRDCLNYGILYGNIAGAVLTASVAAAFSFKAVEVTGRAKPTWIVTFAAGISASVVLFLIVTVSVTIVGVIIGIAVGITFGFGLSRVQGTVPRLCTVTLIGIMCRFLDVI